MTQAIRKRRGRPGASRAFAAWHREKNGNTRVAELRLVFRLLLRMRRTARGLCRTVCRDGRPSLRRHRMVTGAFITRFRSGRCRGLLIVWVTHPLIVLNPDRLIVTAHVTLAGI